ncbi:DUF2092 domain-containing protein [Thiorhodococcus minor]|uniref:DUF2092 domain-containing protein n=1 Tax=Thiorhodococcus minor TaxID=57489 RepID=A0A6M0K2Q0_9GAMM|nr:DUF2092 domain-containing protein [Thiorhodococcus minor]NEV64048.1 DUF2092 domain-containing protein [Thiorhodococcus minor]
MTLRLLGSTVLALAWLALQGPALAQGQAGEGVPQEGALQESLGEIDQAALEALDRMGAYLRTLTAFELKAEDRIDEVLEDGQKIQLNKTVDLQVRRPDRLRAEIETDRKARVVFYDGKQFTIVSPEARFYATVEAPPTIRELLTQLNETYGIEIPLQDLFYWGTDAASGADIQKAMWVGTSKIRGQLTDHYAFRQPAVDWQIWIAQGTAPLPLRYVITTKEEPGAPQFVADMTWNTEAKPADSVFAFAPTEEDRPIEILAQGQVQTTPAGE